MVSNPEYISIPDARGDGRVALSGELDLSSGEQIVDVGLDNTTAISSVNGLYCYNPSLVEVEAEVLSTGQRMKFPAKSENYFPVLTRMPCQLKFSAPAPVAELLTVILTNYSLPEILGGVA